MCKDQRRCGGECVQRRRALIAVTRAGSARISDEQSLRDVVEHAARPPVTHSRAGRTHLAGVVHAESVPTPVAFTGIMLGPAGTRHWRYAVELGRKWLDVV